MTPDYRYWNRTEPTIYPVQWPLAEDWFWFHKTMSGKHEPIEDEE